MSNVLIYKLLKQKVILFSKMETFLCATISIHFSVCYAN